MRVIVHTTPDEGVRAGKPVHCVPSRDRLFIFVRPGMSDEERDLELSLAITLEGERNWVYAGDVRVA